MPNLQKFSASIEEAQRAAEFIAEQLEELRIGYTYYEHFGIERAYYNIDSSMLTIRCLMHELDNEFKNFEED